MKTLFYRCFFKWRERNVFRLIMLAYFGTCECLLSGILTMEIEERVCDFQVIKSVRYFVIPLRILTGTIGFDQSVYLQFKFVVHVNRKIAE